MKKKEKNITVAGDFQRDSLRETSNVITFQKVDDIIDFRDSNATSLMLYRRQKLNTS